MWYDVLIITAGAVAGLGAILSGRRMAAGPVRYVGFRVRRKDSDLDGAGRHPRDILANPTPGVELALEQRILEILKSASPELQEILLKELSSLGAVRQEALLTQMALEAFTGLLNENFLCERCGRMYPLHFEKCPWCFEIVSPTEELVIQCKSQGIASRDPESCTVLDQVKEHSKMIAGQGRAMDEMEKRIRRLEERSSRERFGLLADEEDNLPSRRLTVH